MGSPDPALATMAVFRIVAGANRSPKGAEQHSHKHSRKLYPYFEIDSSTKSAAQMRRPLVKSGRRICAEILAAQRELARALYLSEIEHCGEDNSATLSVHPFSCHCQSALRMPPTPELFGNGLFSVASASTPSLTVLVAGPGWAPPQEQVVPVPPAMEEKEA